MATAALENIIGLVVPDQRCRNEYITNFNIFDESCNKMLISKLLGLGIVAGSILVKLPQIIKILKAKSVVGLSLSSFLLELMAYIFTMSYNVVQGFPFSTWGEALFVLVQAIIQVALFFHFAYSPVAALAFVPLCSTCVYFLCSGLVPLQVVSLLFQATIPLTASSKIFQIGANFTNGHTGQLSMITSFMNLMGTLGRIYTTFQEVKDTAILAAFVSATFFNLVIVLQIVYYWNVSPDLDKKRK
ncbi:mannose-P-dolichol utilization defect 1 protein-like [Sycon ciliatum]|uniref:mannose-P-dolichol utilization defect 1 protein-like n=1 Tax=Sycon ciliatum TaxID=27933 RepID=UPI0020AC04B8|eukprot:scpid81619/ scgid10839/ Mannose-P-dolichol utilization defect 1 protein; Suppressor of Lec15 and Lec35 glycosylation mutation homolog